MEWKPFQWSSSFETACWGCVYEILELVEETIEIGRQPSSRRNESLRLWFVTSEIARYGSREVTQSPKRWRQATTGKSSWSDILLEFLPGAVWALTAKFSWFFRNWTGARQTGRWLVALQSQILKRLNKRRVKLDGLNIPIETPCGVQVTRVARVLNVELQDSIRAKSVTRVWPFLNIACSREIHAYV